MRPVIKGDHPEKDGVLVKFKSYSRSRRYLIDRIGEYCSYCERKIVVNLAVEHVQPKSLEPSLKLKWENFLLGCTNCNSTKGNKPVELTEYFWPDIDNTYEVFLYDISGIVKVSPLLSRTDKKKAMNMINLVGLNKIPPKIGTVGWEEASDRRFEHRVKAFKNAQDALEKYKGANKSIKKIMLPFIVTLVIESGFWSIWMNAFDQYPEVQEEIISSHKGTNDSFF